MKRLTPILFSLLLAAGGVTASAQETNSTISIPGQDFSSFDIIARKNIFDQSRVGITSLSRRRAQPRIERITLEGIGGGGNGDALFSGHDEPLKTGDHIAGFQLSRITPDWVQLTSSNKTVVLDPDYTNTLRRVDDGPWEMSSIASEPVDTSTNASSETAAATPGATDAPRPGESAIERKLRLRREQEEK
jgi:hypothetical protein